MKRLFSDKMLRNPFSRDWEAGVRKVLVEPCDSGEDPLGYRAVFLLKQEAALAEKKMSFVIGASFLAQRAHNLVKAGYRAPMTRKAIARIESRIGQSLPA